MTSKTTQQSSQLSDNAVTEKAVTEKAITEKAITELDIRGWLVNYMCGHLNVESKKIDLDLEFDSFGLDSAVIIEMTAELEDYLGNMLDPTLVYDYHTINRLAKHLGTSAQGQVFWQKDLHSA